MGTPYILSQKLIIWNRDSVPRTVLITVEAPPTNAISLGYESIPNEIGFNFYPATIVVKGNSFAEIQILVDIPRWESMTGQKWEVWILVERQPLPGETSVLRSIVRMKIETTSELPPIGDGGTITAPAPAPSGVSIRLTIGIVILIAILIACVTIGVAILLVRRRKAVAIRPHSLHSGRANGLAKPPEENAFIAPFYHLGAKSCSVSF